MGPNTAIGASITDTFPPQLTNVTYTSVATGGASGNTISGAGNIIDTVTMPAGSTITYTASATVTPTATGTITNTATVGAPAGTTDPHTSNNQATDSDTMLFASSLAGFVYVDANNDGIRQLTEQGIAGVVITLSGTNDLGQVVNQVVTTAADGSYRFTNLRAANAGGYTLRETQPGGFGDGRETIGSPSLNATAADNIFTNIGLTPGTNAVGFDFGELLTILSILS